MEQVAFDMYHTAPARVTYPTSYTNDQIVDTFYTNTLGRAPDAEGKAYWSNQLGARTVGQVVSDMITAVVNFPATGSVAGLTSKSLFNNKVMVGEHFAEVLHGDDITLANNALMGVTSDEASVATVKATNTAAVTPVTPPTSRTIALTAAADTGSSFIGTAGNDTFTGTYDATVTDTFNDTDVLNGAGGTDTLSISHILDVSITPPDALWTGVRGFEKLVINTTGSGAQTITTGPMFEAAFHGNGVTGVDLTTKTTGGGAIDINMTSFGGTATLTTTSTAGAQTITTGSGVTSVTAESGAGALTIQGVGLATVSATTTGNGAQTIGDAGGNGAHLVTVTATSNSGAQTITSTSTSAVTVTATSTSGPQTIVTGTGADSVTARSAAGTSNTITTNAGNDTISAGLGNDLITGGLGADSMTGGGGINTYAFGANGSIIGTSMDIITDFNHGGADILNFGATTTVRAADASALVAGTNVQTTACGMISFHAADSSLSLKIVALQADAELDVAGSVAMFVDGGNTYVYYAGTAAGNADDQLVQLTGISTLATITGGSTVTIV
ncbi:MAG: DUF4214 domain-containing protein [Proteobacteria bacterium]|nr:DUF4214 domain-containing protein [Pseudomonadota bacterium]